jgi:N,N'-diacetyllegionaminate synthase
MENRTLIIAEAGVNHNGDLDMAKQLVDVAAEAGADLVKFQTFNASRLVTESASKADYQILSTGENESQYEMLSRFEMSVEMHEELIRHCAIRNIGFFSTGFDIESIDLLVSLGQSKFKIPSGEITNLPYLRHIGLLDKPVILSTGMADMDEIKAAIDVIEKAGTSRSNITVLHCTTEYPTPMDEVNLNAMKSIQTAFGVGVGSSDHSIGIEIAIAAVAMGACVIEKHLTIDRTLPGPDHMASLEPEELKSMVTAIRNIEVALGDGIKRLSTSEAKNKVIVRKSLVAICTIKEGEVFSTLNITAKRPGSGISPMLWDDVIGQIAIRDFAVDELIEL